METPENRLKRLRLRSWRRGTKEMDLILGGYADAMLPTLTSEELDQYELIMEENDHDLYAWVSGQMTIPDGFEMAIRKIQTQFLT